MTRVSPAILLLSVLCPAPVAAHPFAPAGFRVELEPGGASVVARIPRRVRIGERPALAWPSDCRETLEGERRAGAFLERRARLRCERPLAGRTLRLVGVVEGGTTGLLRVAHADGVEERLLDAAEPRLRLPEAAGEEGRPGQGRGSVGGGWFWAGVVHLGTGLDHLLLLAGLVMTIGFRRRLLVALAAFTLGHAITLLLAAFIGLTPPAALVEPAILATLVLVGLELPEGPRSVVARRPVGVPLLVGLVHGGGFAGALGGLAASPSELLAQLVPFHLGLEATQLVLVSLLAAAHRLGAPAPAPTMAGRLVGAVAIAWLLGLLVR